MDNGASSYLRFLNGNEEGFVDMIREYKDGLMLFINSIIGDIHISEEAADDVFMKLYIDKPKYKGEYSFKTWLYAMGKNSAIDYLRKIRRKTYTPIEDYYYMCDEADIEAEYIKNEENLSISQVIRGLKREYSQVLFLKYFENLNNVEIAEIMGKSQRQISDLIYRAKASLKKELERRGIHGQI